MDLKVPCRLTVTRKVLTVCVTEEATSELESVSLVTSKATAFHVTPESGLVQQEDLMSPTRAASAPFLTLITGIRQSRQWDTSWYSKKHKMIA